MGTTYWQIRWIYASLILLLLVGTAEARRISRPDSFKLPWTEEQVTNISNTLEDIFLMQKGRFEFDIVTTTKTNANNGEIWMIQTGSTVYIQYKAADHIFSITPDGF